MSDELSYLNWSIHNVRDLLMTVCLNAVNTREEYWDESESERERKRECVPGAIHRPSKAWNASKWEWCNISWNSSAVLAVTLSCSLCFSLHSSWPPPQQVKHNNRRVHFTWACRYAPCQRHRQLPMSSPHWWRKEARQIQSPLSLISVSLRSLKHTHSHNKYPCPKRNPC